MRLPPPKTGRWSHAVSSPGFPGGRGWGAESEGHLALSNSSVSPRTPKVTELGQLPRRWGSRGCRDSKEGRAAPAGPGQRHCCAHRPPPRVPPKDALQTPSQAGPSAWTPLVLGPPSGPAENSTHPKKELSPTFKTLGNFPGSLSAKKPFQTRPIYTDQESVRLPLHPPAHRPEVSSGALGHYWKAPLWCFLVPELISPPGLSPTRASSGSHLPLSSSPWLFLPTPNIYSETQNRHVRGDSERLSPHGPT